MSVLIASDTATAFAMSFGIAKFSLAQLEAKLVGEIVGRFGRCPQPSNCESHKELATDLYAEAVARILGDH